MYPFGLPVAVDLFLVSGFRIWIAVAFVTLVLLLIAVDQPTEKDDAPVVLPGFCLINIWRFFSRRFDFLNSGFDAVGQHVFQFSLLQHTVIAVSGESARKAFFTTRGFDLTEGFKVLSGAIPMVPGVTSDLQSRRISLIHKRLSAIQRPAILSQKIPVILSDFKRVMDAWGRSGTFDPFDAVYELLFQSTVRSLTCSEIADDSALVARLKILYDRLDHGTTPATVLLPWFPSLGMLNKLFATKQIYDIVSKAINTRQESGVAHDDTLQMLLDLGDEKAVIVGFIMGLLIAGARATGTSASWMITFLGANAEWRSKARAEIQQLLEACLADHQGPSPTPTLADNLSAIPLDEWENNTPILDRIIKETLRVAQPHAAMRRNMGREVYIDGKLVPTGAYVLYPFSDVHLDPMLYPDPWKFDPSREMATKAAFGFVGWGAGNTVCLGTRLAKIMLKMVAAMFLLGFDITVVDRYGSVVDPLPQPNWNDSLLCRPAKGACYIKYERNNMQL